jgi:hypothetical protein
MLVYCLSFKKMFSVDIVSAVVPTRTQKTMLTGAIFERLQTQERSSAPCNRLNSVD